MVAVRWRLELVSPTAFKLEDTDSDDVETQSIANFQAVQTRRGKLLNKNPIVDSGTWYYGDHVREDGYNLSSNETTNPYVIPILFDVPSSQAATIAFTVSGTAVEGTHFNLVTPSPLTVFAGASQALISVELLDVGTWYDEKSIIFTLTSGTGITLGSRVEYHLWVYPTELAPEVSFDTTSDSGGPGSYNVDVNLDTASGENVELYYRVTSSSGLDSSDYSVAGGGIVAGETSTTGASSTPITLTVNGTAASGETITIELDHEPSDRSRENWWTHTNSWKPELYSMEYDGDAESNGKPILYGYAGEPTTHGNSGGAWSAEAPEDKPYPAATGNTIIGLDEENDPQLGSAFWSIDSADQKAKPDGTVMQAVLMNQQAFSDFYIRESFEAAQYAGTKPASAQIQEYNLISVYVDDIPAPEDNRTSKFVRMTQRNRPRDMENAVIFWRESDGSDSAGNPSRLYSNGSQVATVTTDTGTWGLWALKNAHPNDKWGVEEETVNGVKYTRLWYRHYVPAAGFWYAQNGSKRRLNIGGAFESSATSASAGGTTLVDGNANFQSATPSSQRVAVGDVVTNLADFSVATVLSVDSENQLTLSGLQGGYDDDWAVGDEYQINGSQSASTGEESKQQQNDEQNILLRFTMYKSGDNYGTRTQDSAFFQDNNNGQGRGLCAWGPMYVQSTSELLVGNKPTQYAPPEGEDLLGPGRYWERSGNWPRPRGLAYGSSANQVFTFTVS